MLIVGGKGTAYSILAGVVIAGIFWAMILL